MDRTRYLAVEVLAIKIRSSVQLEGVKISNYEKRIKIAQYADDTILFLNNEQEIESAFKTIESFGNVSGLRLNKGKCDGFWLGASKHKQKNCTLYGIRWPKQFKYLGIYFGHDKKLNYNMNWQSKINKIELLLKKWSKRELRMFGKIQVIKSLALPQLTLVATVLATPKNVVKDINKILFKFLWNSTEKVKRLKLIQKAKLGGLNMIDTESYILSLKAYWVNRIKVADPNSHCWAQLPTYYFKPLFVNDTGLMFNYDTTVMFGESNSLPAFYKEVFL